MTRFMLLMLAAACACATPPVVENGFTDLYTAPIEAVLPREIRFDRGQIVTHGDWRSMVESAGDVWNTALIEVGCEPLFRMADKDEYLAYPVILYSYEVWPHKPEDIGTTFGGKIGVGHADLSSISPRNRPGNLFYVLMHELGHALGLMHQEDSADAIMSPVAWGKAVPTAIDKIALRDALGCQ